MGPNTASTLVLLLAAVLGTLEPVAAQLDRGLGAAWPFSRVLARRRLQPGLRQNLPYPDDLEQGAINAAPVYRYGGPSWPPMDAVGKPVPRAPISKASRRFYNPGKKRLLMAPGVSGGGFHSSGVGGDEDGRGSGGRSSSSGSASGLRQLRRELRRELLQQSQGRCVCAFDFDHTLRIERDGRQDAPAPDANGIILECKLKGYGIAIASANGDLDKIDPVLRRLDASTFNGAFYKSAAFQIGEARKSKELERIAGYYGTPAACIMLFDDSSWNKKYADETGAVWRQVDGSKGITWYDYQQAQQQLEQQCVCR